MIICEKILPAIRVFISWYASKKKAILMLDS